MNRKTIALFLAIATITAITGCTEPSSEESGSAASPAQSEGSSQEPEKTYAYYECVATVKGFQPQQVRWDADGGFSVRQKDTILFVDHDNEPVKTFRPVDRDWPDRPWESSDQDWEDPTFCEYTWNETYVLACFHLYGSLDAVVVEKDGLPTLADAAIYTMDGRLVKAFPSTYDQDVKNRSDNERCSANELCPFLIFFWLCNIQQKRLVARPTDTGVNKTGNDFRRISGNLLQVNRQRSVQYVRIIRKTIVECVARDFDNLSILQHCRQEGIFTSSSRRVIKG